jgi:hypothetical protein
MPFRFLGLPCTLPVPPLLSALHSPHVRHYVNTQVVDLASCIIMGVPGMACATATSLLNPDYQVRAGLGCFAAVREGGPVRYSVRGTARLSACSALNDCSTSSYLRMAA